MTIPNANQRFNETITLPLQFGNIEKHVGTLMFKHRTSRIMREHTHTYAHPSRRLHKHLHKHKPKATSTHISTPNAVLKAPCVTREQGSQCVPRSMEFWFGFMLERGLFVTSFLPVRTSASL